MSKMMENSFNMDVKAKSNELLYSAFLIGGCMISASNVPETI